MLLRLDDQRRALPDKDDVRGHNSERGGTQEHEDTQNCAQRLFQDADEGEDSESREKPICHFPCTANTSFYQQWRTELPRTSCFLTTFRFCASDREAGPPPVPCV